MSPLRSGYAGLHLAHAHDERSAFGARQERAGGAAGVSLVAHVLFLLVTYVVVARPDPSRVASAPEEAVARPELVWLDVPGRGGGGGGGGNRMTAPPARLQTRGLDALSVPVLTPPPLTPPREEPEPGPDPQVSAIVRPDGTVTDVRLSRSLDRVFGLDEEAIKAVRQWRFKPATRLGQPVAVYVTIGVGFTMH